MKKATAIAASTLSYLVMAGSAFAALGGGGGGDGGWTCIYQSPPSFACLPSVIANVINGFLLFSGTVAMFFIIFAGVKYLTSAGDPKKVEGAKQTLTYAIIGLIVVLSAFFIINFLEYVTGITGNRLTFPDFPEPNPVL